MEKKSMKWNTNRKNPDNYFSETYACKILWNYEIYMMWMNWNVFMERPPQMYDITENS